MMFSHEHTKSKPAIIYDATVIINSRIAAGMHSTGLFRVANELLKQIVAREVFNIYLFDILYREREIQNLVKDEFPNCKSFRLHSNFTRLLIFPIGGLSDRLKKSENKSTSTISRHFYKIGKILCLKIYKNVRKIERGLFITRNFRRNIRYISAYYATYFPIPEIVREDKKILKIWTLHDLIPIKHPEFFSSPYNQQLLKSVVNKIQETDTVFCVSESTRRDFSDFRPDIDTDKVLITPNAASEKFHPVKNKVLITNCKNKYGLPAEARYFLSLCTLEPRKNLITVVQSFESLIKSNNNNNHYLVLTGAIGWDSGKLLDLIDNINSKYNSRIIVTGFVPDDDLAPLYSGATAFLYPSLYEGFGLPVLEAMKCGLPVITSNTSSLPELVIDNGILVNPINKDEITEAMKSIITDKKLVNHYKKKAIARSAAFRWERTAEMIIKTIQTRLS